MAATGYAYDQTIDGDGAEIPPRLAPIAARGAVFRSLLDDERTRFFLWAPVCLGVGIAAYFALPVEPDLFAAAVPLIIALIIKAAVPRGSVMSVVVTALVRRR